MLAWWSFIFALVSGIVLAFHYRPWGDVFTGVSRIEGLIPYGSFLRRLHYLSGQCFLLFTLAHTLEHFIKRAYDKVKPGEWVRLAAMLALAFFLVFTGFILKGDREAILAGRVMHSLAGEVPLAGRGLAGLLIRPGEEFFLLPYLYHNVILTLSVVVILVRHRRRLIPTSGLGWPLLAVLAALSLVWPLPPDIPPTMQVAQARGPWFFQGVQLLLRRGNPFWAGVVWPLLPLVLLAGLPYLPERIRRAGGWTVAGVWLLHGVILAAAWFALP